jgi:hypothetical protein
MSIVFNPAGGLRHLMRLALRLAPCAALLCVPLSASPVAGSGSAQQGQKPLVAILEPVAGAGVTPMNRNTFHNTFHNQIFTGKKYRVVPRDRTELIMKKHTATRGGAIDNGKVKEIGTLLLSDYVCVSDLRTEGGHFKAVCSFIDVRSGETSASITELIATESAADFKAGAERAIRALLAEMDDFREGAPREAAPARPTPIDRPSDRPTDRPTDSNEIREAKAAVNRLMPYFSFSRGKSGVTCTNWMLSKYEEDRRKHYAVQGVNWSPYSGYWWHSLFAEIRPGGLAAFSRYTYVLGTGYGNDNYALSHTTLAVDAAGKALSVPLAPVREPSPTADDRAGSPFSGSAGAGSGAVEREDGAIHNEDVLRAIAAARGKSVKVTLKGIRSREYVLDQSVQEGIAQTIELYDAIRVLKKAGVEIQERYELQ